MVTVAEVFDRYRGSVLGYVAEGTQRGYMAAWRTRVAPSFGDVDISAITPLDVEEAFLRWTGAYSTRRDAVAMLSRICKQAVKAGLIPGNPCLGIELARLQKSDVSARALSAEEVERLLVVLPAEGPYRRFVLALLFTGCRLGEIAGLLVSDVDLVRGVIRVSRTASPGIGGRMNVGPTKGRRVRMVPIVEAFRPELVAAMAGKGPHDLLFPGAKGGYLNSKNLSRALKWHSIRDSVKTFPPGEAPLCWHDLRHTAITLWFESGASAPDVQAVAGHSSLVVTQMYADTRGKAALRLGDSFDAFFNEKIQGHRALGAAS